MAKYHIKATEPEMVESKSLSFRYWTGANGGNAQLTLSPYGDYTLVVLSGMSEGTVKRTDAYKNAVDSLTKEMHKAYEAESAAYTLLHRNMVTIPDRSKAETQLQKLAPKTYTKQSILLPRPTKKEVEADLIAEAESYQHTYKEEGFSVDAYVKQRLNTETENRQARWQEALELFESIENAREERTNAQYYAEYEIEKHKLEDYLSGEESVIQDGISAIEMNLVIPVNLFLEYKYQQKEGILDVDLTLEDTIPVAVMKTEINASGKISIKNKLVRELTDDRTRCALGLMYLIGSHLFAISPNIQYVRIALWSGNKTAGYAWLSFDRASFSRLVPRRLTPELDVYNFPNVINLKAKNNAVEITPIEAPVFKKMIENSKKTSVLTHQGLRDY